MTNFYKKDKGFSLIELMVVIAIIGILSSIVFVSLDDARAKARNLERYSVVKEHRNAIELYIIDDQFNQVPDYTEVCIGEPNGSWQVHCLVDPENINNALEKYFPRAITVSQQSLTSDGLDISGVSYSKCSESDCSYRFNWFAEGENADCGPGSGDGDIGGGLTLCELKIRK